MKTIIAIVVIFFFFAYVFCYLRIVNKKIAREKYRDFKKIYPELSHQEIKSLVIDFIIELNSGSNTNRDINDW